MNKKINISTQIIRFPELSKKLGNVSRSTIDRWEAANAFPKRIHLGKNSIGWNLNDIEEWIILQVARIQ